MRFRRQHESLRKDRKAVSPAISTVILTAAVVIMVLVATAYANNFLDVRIAENEFSSSKQFMLTTGLQVDDVAWTIGRTQTVRYSSRYGNVKFAPSVLNYTFEVDCGSGFQPVNYTTTGIILYNMPTSIITYGNNYFERIFPSSNGSLLQNGPSAPVAHVFVVEKLPMADGSYTRVVVAPSIRMLNSTVGTTTYVTFYLPTLNEGSNLYLSQSLTLTGNDVTKVTINNVMQVRISVAFPSASQGFTQDFFNFEKQVITLNSTSSPILPSNSVVELYFGKVLVSLGLHT
jgi:hypothetical protein